MKFLLFVFSTWITIVFCEQPSSNYNNNAFHNQRYQEERISSTSERIFQADDKSRQLISSRGSRTFSFDEYVDDGSYDESFDGSLVETIPGKAGKDFPAYTTIPKTGFTCKGRSLGYFADPETNCQVFHICVEGGQKISFLCPNGSIFNQKVSVCDWWYDVDCISSSELIDSNDIQKNSIYNEPSNDFQYQHFIVETEPYYDLSLASSGGNQHPKYENQASKTSKNNVQNVDNKNSSHEGRKKISILKSKSTKASSTSASIVKEDKNGPKLNK